MTTMNLMCQPSLEEAVAGEEVTENTKVAEVAEEAEEAEEAEVEEVEEEEIAKESNEVVVEEATSKIGTARWPSVLN